jgi:hypothetical protein
MPEYEQVSGTLVEARLSLITEENKEDITEWCQEGQTFRMIAIPEIVGDRNIGDYVVQMDFGFVVMTAEVFGLFYKEKQ